MRLLFFLLIPVLATCQMTNVVTTRDNIYHGGVNDFTGALAVKPYTAFTSDPTGTSCSNAAAFGAKTTSPTATFICVSGQWQKTSSSGVSGCGNGNPTCTIADGGTNATTATAATHNLQFLSPYTGSAARPNDSKMNDIVSVLDLQADPTGIVDSSSAFQATLNAVSIRPGAGVRAYIPCGVYKLNSTVNISKIQQSLVGENESCVTLQYQGTVGAIQFVMAPESGGDSGELGNFTIQLPNAIAGTYGVWNHTSGAWIHNIQITTCLLATGFKIDNGLTDNTGGVSFYEHNLWTDTKTDHCAIGYRLSDGGIAPAPTFMYMGYNNFDSINANLDLGEIGFQVDAGPLFYNSILNLNCKMGNSFTSGNSACVKSGGFWDHNISNITGEYNNAGTGVGTVSSVWVTSAGTFRNIGGTVAINFLTPGSTGALVPMQVDAGGLTVLNKPLSIGMASQQPTCNAETRNWHYTIQGGTGVADIYQVCLKNSSDAYAWITK